ncbi:hypothetical protein ABIE09_000043 [Lysobacter enzymogenes]|uniref:hypothetical protein n=1 Tax=Lysobacter enzymogenes TaxID=69 RepID=UPI0033980C77
MKIGSRICVLVCLVTMPVIAYSAELGSSPFVPQDGGPAMIKALSAANRDFLSKLPQTTAKDSKIDQFAANPDNYKIVIDHGEEGYVIDYEIKPFEGSGFRGGGYRYIVDDAGYRILKVIVSP